MGGEHQISFHISLGRGMKLGIWWAFFVGSLTKHLPIQKAWCLGSLKRGKQPEHVCDRLFPAWHSVVTVENCSFWPVGLQKQNSEGKASLWELLFLTVTEYVSCLKTWMAYQELTPESRKTDHGSPNNPNMITVTGNRKHILPSRHFSHLNFSWTV